MENQPSGFNLNRPQHVFSRAPEAGAETPPAAGDKEPKFVTRVLDKLITVSLFMIFLGVPLFFTGRSFQGLAFEKEIYFYFWLLLALVVWASRGVIIGELKIRRTPLDIPILVFWVIYLLATIFSVDRWHSFVGFPGDPSRGFISITALVIAYYLIVSTYTSQRLTWFLRALLISGAVVTLWTFLGVMGIKFMPDKLAAFAPLSLVGTMSGAGLFLGMLVPVIMMAAFRSKTEEGTGTLGKKIYVGALLVMLAVDLFLFFILYAFVPWVALLIGIGFLLIFILSQVVRPPENWAWLPMVVFVIVMVIMMVGNTFNLARVSLPVEVTPNYQLSWQVAKSALKDKFVLGSGAATYGYDFSKYKPQNFNDNALYNLRFYQGTGIIAEALPTIGVLGVIGLLLVILTFVSVAVYLLASHKERNKVYSLGFVTAALILLVAGITGRVESAIIIMGALMGAVAIATLVQESGTEERAISLSLKASPKYALALAFVFMVISAGVAYLFVLIGKLYIADLYAGSAVLQSQPSENGSIASLVKAINLNSRESRYFTRVSQEYMALANTEMLKSADSRDINTVQRYLNNSIAAAVQARNLMPNDVLAVSTQAQIYENAGIYVPDSLKLAQDSYQQALDLEPHNPVFILKLGQIKLSQAVNSQSQDEKKQLVNDAKDFFQRSISEKQNFPDGYYQLSVAEEALGDLDGAIDNMQKAFALDNSSINYAFNLGRLYQARGKGDDNAIAESLFKQILGVNNKEINTHFSLGLLYEKTNRKDQAVTEYKTVLDLLPAGSDTARAQIQKMISNIQNGIENTPDNLKS